MRSSLCIFKLALSCQKTLLKLIKFGHVFYGNECHEDISFLDHVIVAYENFAYGSSLEALDLDLVIGNDLTRRTVGI